MYNVREECAAANIYPEDSDITLLRNVGTSLCKKSQAVKNLKNFVLDIAVRLIAKFVQNCCKF
jgi:hypothetical protein